MNALYQKAKAVFGKVAWGTFQSGEQQNTQAYALCGGEIDRPPAVAAGLNSLTVNNREMLADVWDATSFAYVGVLPQTNNAWQFQYVGGDGYSGILPYQVQPQFPDPKPWE